MDKEKLIAIAMKRLDVPGLLGDVVDEILEPTLKEFVADTSNPYDDMLVAAAYPVLEAELKKKVAELWAQLGEEVAPA